MKVIDRQFLSGFIFALGRKNRVSAGAGELSDNAVRCETQVLKQPAPGPLHS